MGKKIRVNASNEPAMFQFFKQYVHQTDKNEFYCDGEYAYPDNPGVEVDFQNIQHTYELFLLLGNYWGGWNSTPTSNEMYNVAKEWESRFAAEIIEMSYDSVGFRFGRVLSDAETDDLINECKNLYANANRGGGYEEMKKIIKEKSELHILWD